MIRFLCIVRFQCLPTPFKHYSEVILTPICAQSIISWKIILAPKTFPTTEFLAYRLHIHNLFCEAEKYSDFGDIVSKCINHHWNLILIYLCVDVISLVVSSETSFCQSCSATVEWSTDFFFCGPCGTLWHNFISNSLKKAFVRKGHKQESQTGAHLETLVSIWTVF